MLKILLSIKPEYADKIIKGIKKFEYRKHIANKTIGAILIYSTNPVKKIIGEVQILGHIFDSPNALWEKTKSNAGISRDKFRDYFKGTKTAYAYVLGEVILFYPAKNLEDYNIKAAPQSFVYVND